MASFVVRLAKMLYRSPEEARHIHAATVIRARQLLFFSIIGCVSFASLALLAVRMSRMSQQFPDVIVDASEWRAASGASPPCAYDADSTPRCFAARSNPALWLGSRSRTDQRRGPEYWVGVSIPASSLRDAAKRKANSFWLGFVRGTVRVWVDGKFLSESRRGDNEPLAFPIAIPRLLEGAPLKIAVQVVGDAAADGLPMAFGFARPTGFAAKPKIADWRRMHVIYLLACPLALFLASLILACVFFLVWSANRTRQELFYLSIYATLHALAHFKAVGGFAPSVNPETLDAYGVVVAAWCSVFPMWVGFSLARMRPVAFRVGMPVTAIAPLLLAWGMRDPLTRQRAQSLFCNELGAVFALLGAAACVLQASVLRMQRGHGIALPARERSLFCFALGLMVIAVGCGFDFDFDGASPSFRPEGIFWMGTLSMVVLAFLGATALRESREDRQYALKVPASPYHQRSVLPAAVSGAVLAVDIKNAESMFLHGSPEGSVEALIDACLTQMWSAIADRGGIVLYVEKSTLWAFFDEENCESAELAALQTLDEIVSHSSRFEQQLHERYALSARPRLHYRASIARGTIRPAWHEIGTMRYPAWDDVSDSNVFVESRRLMDLESSLPSKGRGAETRLVISEELAMALCGRAPRLASGFIARNLSLRGKHGREACVAFYVPLLAKGPARAA